MEKCFLCDAGSETPYDIVGIGKDESDEFAAFPVCKSCHENPAHRTKEGAKLHFHSRSNAANAVQAARSQILLASNNESVIRQTV